MKRLHIHIKTDDLNRSVVFYAAAFGKAPDRLEADYAKWLLDQPAANIAVSTRGEGVGVDHLGLSVDDRPALEAGAASLHAAGFDLKAEEATTCCYAQSNKYWARDPNGVAWELFQTFGEADHFGSEPELAVEMAPNAERAPEKGACCAPRSS